MDNPKPTQNNAPLIHSLDAKPASEGATRSFILTVIGGAIALGLVTGLVLGKMGGGKTATTADSSNTSTNTTQSAGIADKKTFKDTAQGMLIEGGIENEGSYTLQQKPKDRSQDVALTSSTVDLSQFVGKKVEVWGETQTAQVAGWFMDVGYVEVIK